MSSPDNSYISEIKDDNYKIMLMVISCMNLLFILVLCIMLKIETSERLFPADAIKHNAGKYVQVSSDSKDVVFKWNDEIAK